MFSVEEIKSILRNFPKFELCYEMITHKKVHNSNVILAIPQGKKCFAWFTNYKSDNVCFLLYINETNNIIDVQIAKTTFNDKLSLGTIFYGTVFNKIEENNMNNFFCVEDLYYYAGKFYGNTTYLSKLERMKEIFKNELSQIALANNFTIFGLPLMSNDFQTILKDIPQLPYKVSEIKFRFFGNENSRKIYVMKYFKPGSNKNDNKLINKGVFKMTADIEPDIYNLFAYDYKNGTEEYYDIAFVPDYKTSVMMNKLFRNIKENDNLDAIEESDDEEEFQDNREDKYVYLDRSFKINCEYNNKFKRWVPVSLANTNDKIISMTVLKNY